MANERDNHKEREFQKGNNIEYGQESEAPAIKPSGSSAAYILMFIAVAVVSIFVVAVVIRMKRKQQNMKRF